MKRWIVVLLVAWAAACGEGRAEAEPAQPLRTWVSASGSKMEASFVSLSLDQVTLRKADGTDVRIRLQQLSPDDQKHVRSLTITPAPGAKSAPAPASGLQKLFGNKLIKADQQEVPVDSLGDRKIGIYFSASWCGPCRAFTPKLVETYQQLGQEGKPFEVVLVSSDRSEDAMLRYMKDAGMPWLAVPFSAKEREDLMKKFDVNGIPRLVVVSASGKTLSDNARGDVMERGIKAYDKW